MFQIRMEKYLLWNTGKRSLKVPGRMGRKETQNFVSGTEKRNGRNYGNQDKSVEKKLGYIDEKLEKSMAEHGILQGRKT